MNPELLVSLSDKSKKRDAHFMEIQALAGNALAYVGSALSSIMAESGADLDKTQNVTML